MGAAEGLGQPCIACTDMWACAQENAARLKAYKAKLVLFPVRSKKPKSGDASAEERKVQQQHEGPLLPVVHEAHKLETVKLTDELKVSILRSHCSQRKGLVCSAIMLVLMMSLLGHAAAVSRLCAGFLGAG